LQAASAAREYYGRTGNSDPAWVESLYRNLLNRNADAGESYWLQVLTAAGV
jgi:hypothetical protein